MVRGEWLINTFLLYIQTVSLILSVILRIDWLMIPSTSLEETGFISYFSPQTLFLLSVLLVKCEYHNVARDLHPLPHFVS